MFPLYTQTFPPTAAELEVLLNGSMERVFSGATQSVAVRDKLYPELAEIRISLDGAQLRPNPPRPPLVTGQGSPALELEELNITGSNLTLGPAIADLSLHAEKLRFNQAPDGNGERVLLIQNAQNGTIEIATSKSALENAIAALAKSEAGKHGVTIDQVRLSVEPRGPRSIDAAVELRAKKLFFTTVIRVAAKLDLDEELNAKISGLRCHGEGAIGSLACGVLEPHLQKLDGRSYALMALPLGEVRLRDVRLAATDKLSVTALFGA